MGKLHWLSVKCSRFISYAEPRNMKLEMSPQSKGQASTPE